MKNKAEKSRPRLEGLDLARFLALFGMVIVNFKIAMGVEQATGILGQLSGALEGRAAASFVVLAGIGLGLAYRGAFQNTLVTALKRALFLLVLGLANMLIFEADILHYYAFYFAFGALLLPFGTGVLIAIVVALNLAFVAMLMVFNYDAGWDWVTLTYSGFWTPQGFIRNLFFNGWHPVVPWLGFLVVGIILSRLTLAERSTQWRLFLGGIVGLIATELVSGFMISLVPNDPELAVLLGTAPVPPMPLYTVAGISAACLVVGASLLLAPTLQKWRLMQLFTPAGRQTLTLYIAHILIGMGTLEALGMLGGQSIEAAFSAAILFVLAAMTYAWIWKHVFKRGPIEAVMRKLAG
ncbi:hypothetical protein TRP8649_01739 [Pelagimonas phthalicica]|uniref:Transporter n=1 Tax=Pelagimonas phthalicica TaxID=1037362 RepID=A0A238JCD9_9RHOB|nr:DUF418 domain-containing protein [Pelagimonas phthalicica]TDS93844.1 putative membrane protein YeiB [Pelagimonas phthalicica]SMX27632.1 hypothetical protein TRP8649_01739 [Pelagimonas phthalicica]